MILFGGSFQRAAKEGYAFAVGEGFRGFGPLVYAELMSWGKDAWLFQSTIARKLGCSVRTVQRWLHEFRELGLLKCFRGKKGEVPPGVKSPISCGFSHRVLTAWHAAGSRFRELCEEIRLKREAKRAVRRAPAHYTTEQKVAWLNRQIGEPDS